jgi:ATP-binding cassette subfamily F protein uup
VPGHETSAVASAVASETASSKKPEAKGPSGLTYAEKKELAGLLERVDAAEQEVARLEAAVADPAFYEGPVDEQQARFAALEKARRDAEALAERWADLEDRREG